MAIRSVSAIINERIKKQKKNKSLSFLAKSRWNPEFVIDRTEAKSKIYLKKKKRIDDRDKLGFGDQSLKEENI